MLLLIRLYYVINHQVTDAPPRLSILPGLLRGEYDLVHHGPSALKVFFDAKDTQLYQREVYTITIPVFGRIIVDDVSARIVQQQLKFVHKGLNQYNMNAPVSRIVMEAEEGGIHLTKELFELISLTAYPCLFCREVQENDHEEFAHQYQQLYNGISQLSFFSPNVSTAEHRKRNLARLQIAQILEKIIKERRQTQLADPDVHHNDFLQALIQAKYTDQSIPTDDEISGEKFAYLQVKTIGSILLRKFAFEYSQAISESDYSTLVVGSKPPCMVRCRRRTEEK